MESVDSFDAALSTSPTSEDGFSDTSKEGCCDLEESLPGAKRRAILVNKPENERRKVKLFSRRVSSRSGEHKESQKHP